MSAPINPGQQGPWVPNPQPPVPATPPAPRRAARQADLRAVVRIVGSAVIAVVAVLTVAFLGPQDVSTDASSERMVIWLDDEANQERTQGAPQQQVVNGWTGNALLDLISSQLDEQPAPDDRPAILLTLAVILLGLSVATTPPRILTGRS